MSRLPWGSVSVVNLVHLAARHSLLGCAHSLRVDLLLLCRVPVLKPKDTESTCLRDQPGVQAAPVPLRSLQAARLCPLPSVGSQCPKSQQESRVMNLSLCSAGKTGHQRPLMA